MLHVTGNNCWNIFLELAVLIQAFSEAFIPSDFTMLHLVVCIFSNT